MNTLLLVLQGVLLLGLISLSAFFSGCETVLFSLSPIQVQRIRNRNPAVGARLETLLGEPALILSTLLVGNTLVNFAIATVGYMVIDALVPRWSEVIAIPLMTMVLLLFGEVTPKRLAISNAERFAPACSRIIRFWMWLLHPFNMLLTAGSGIFKKSLRRERRALSNEELRTVVEVGEEQGVLDSEEASMVDGIMRLSELKASDEMTPRVDMVGVDLDTPLERQLEVARKSRHRYLPVYVRTPDAIEGFANSVQFLLDPAHDVRKATSPALFVPENVSLDDLLITFQRSGKHIACVLDEYGGTAGLITRSDILELITAPVVKSGAGGHAEIRRLGDDVWLVDGTVSLDEINRQLDIFLEADDADRVAGWVTFHAGRLLQAGQAVEAQGCKVTVRRVNKRRIDAVQIEVLERAAGQEASLAEGDDAAYEGLEGDELS